MLTRLEVHGFKNLLNFSVDFGPLTCIAGPNGVGKSNIFDAIRFLSLLADHSITEAATMVRGEDEYNDLSDIFWRNEHTSIARCRLAAEMIVTPDVRDDFGRSASASSTFLRYELELGYTAPTEQQVLGRLSLLHEDLMYITEGDAVGRLRFPMSAARFRSHVVRNKRRTRSGFITTDIRDGVREILVHQEGNAGRPQRAPAEQAPRTAVAASNTAATPSILAARREMQQWRLLALEPRAMRKPDRFHDPRTIDENGAHVPGALFRLTQESASQGPDGDDLLQHIANRLAELVPVHGLEVRRDNVRQLLTLFVRENSGVSIPARSLSDGTLRFLTLCAMEADPQFNGLICMEEPENGIHPEKIPHMVELLRDMAVDAHDEPSDDNPMRQIIVATHSPYFVRQQHPDDLLMARTVVVPSPARNGGPPAPTRAIRCVPFRGSWRSHEERPGVTMEAVLSYLQSPPGDQLTLDQLREESLR